MKRNAVSDDDCYLNANRDRILNVTSEYESDYDVKTYMDIECKLGTVKTDSDRKITNNMCSDVNRNQYEGVCERKGNSDYGKVESDLFNIELPEHLNDNYTQTDLQGDSMKNNEIKSELFWNDVRLIPQAKELGSHENSVVKSQVTVVAAADKGAASSEIEKCPPRLLSCKDHFYENIEDLKENKTNTDNSKISIEYQRYADPYNIGLVFPAEIETDDELLQNYIDGNIYGNDRVMLRRFIHSVKQVPKYESLDDNKPKDTKGKKAFNGQNLYRRNEELNKNAELLKNVQLNLDILDANINYEIDKIQAIVESETAKLINTNTIRYNTNLAKFDNTDTEKSSIVSSSNTTTNESSSKSLVLEDSMGSLVQYLNSCEDTLSENSADQNEAENRVYNSVVEQSKRPLSENNKQTSQVKTKPSCIIM